MTNDSLTNDFIQAQLQISRVWIADLVMHEGSWLASLHPPPVAPPLQLPQLQPLLLLLLAVVADSDVRADSPPTPALLAGNVSSMTCLFVDGFFVGNQTTNASMTNGSASDDSFINRTSATTISVLGQVCFSSSTIGSSAVVTLPPDLLSAGTVVDSTLPDVALRARTALDASKYVAATFISQKHVGVHFVSKPQSTNGSGCVVAAYNGLQSTIGACFEASARHSCSSPLNFFLLRLLPFL